MDIFIELTLTPIDVFNWITDEIFLFLNGLFDRFGLTVVFFAALLEATVGIGVIVPGVLLMFLGGAYVGTDSSLSLGLVLLMTISGTIIGDTFSYSIGRWGSKFIENTRLAPSVKIGSALVGSKTRWIIPFYHLHNATRAIGPLGAGIVRIPLPIWMPLDYTGAVIANLVWVGGGAIFGKALLTPDGLLKENLMLRIALFIVAIVWFFLLQKIMIDKWQEVIDKNTTNILDDDPTSRT